jgi:hypothetical protein
VIEEVVDDPGAESVRLRRALRGLGIFADVVVISEREAEDWRDVRGSLIHAALSEGRVLAAWWPVQLNLARQLLALAAADLLAARALSDADGIADAIVGFHTQQSVEKP